MISVRRESISFSLDNFTQTSQVTNRIFFGIFNIENSFCHVLVNVWYDGKSSSITVDEIEEINSS